jgi:uncharacterized protein (DUF2126 family)
LLGGYPFGQGKWYPGELFLVNMHYTGEKTVCHYGNDALIAKEGETKLLPMLKKFATELTKYLGIDTKNTNLRDPIYWALERKESYL